MDSSSTPEQVAAEAFRAIEEGRWADLVELFSPADLQRFRESQVHWWQAPPEIPAYTAERIRRHQPDMPLEVAEYHASDVRRRQDSDSRISTYFAGIDTAGQLESLAPAEMLTRYFQAHDPIVRFEALLRSRGLEVPADPRVLGPHYEVIGAVGEGDSLAHVVYRIVGAPVPDGEEPARWPPAVATLERTPEGWRMNSSDNLYGLEGWSIGFDE
jgi:hypothetical protein